MRPDKYVVFSYMKKHKLSAICVGVVVLGWLLLRKKDTPIPAICPKGSFQLADGACREWLNCDDIDTINIKYAIAAGTVKKVYLAEWEDQDIVVSQLANADYLDDFLHGLEMLKVYSESPHVVQLIGYCTKRNVIVTEYHKLGNAINVTKLIHQILGPEDNVKYRLKMCINYVTLLELLHHGPGGKRVMCDSNSLEKLLSQLLVADDLMLILNDLDALPQVESDTLLIKCGHRQITGEFVAPEQLWTKPGPFQDSDMPGYDEKTDIWKAATVCQYFLEDVPDGEIAHYKLFSIHKRCKSKNPRERPTAVQLAAHYIKVLHELTQEL